MGSAARYRPIDLGREFGRSASWPRWLERQGIIPPARRDFSGFRYWTAEDVEEIRRTLERRRTPEPSAA
ncbi:MAG TPA: hypothetical protein VGK42_10090 [Candidatus Dormibacteraeota bacterium]|jgi:DNA-binding transcriptional MerR regulator